MKPWSVARVSALIDFGCGGHSGASESMVKLQTEGVAALCNILHKRHRAYLADEVGLGKTVQALGVAACFLHAKPQARVLVITPRQLVQENWANEFKLFRHRMIRDAARLPALARHDRLRDWLASLGEAQGGEAQGSLVLLRHPSFTRPVFHADGSWEEAVARLELRKIDTLPGPAPVLARGHEDQRGPVYNLAFAQAVNRWLENRGIFFDLVIVDEAQCLRNHEQQTNTVLRTLLRSRTDNWLFLSATPAHSGIHNIGTILNEYSQHEPAIRGEWQDSKNGHACLKKQLRHFMIRRPRTFFIHGQEVHKREYRRDDPDSLALHCTEALGALSIALVQKKLVGLVGERNNRFRNGYIASFESLQESIRHSTSETSTSSAEAHDEAAETVSDFYQDHNPGSADAHAPDENFITTMNQSFREKFPDSRLELPHPKLDAVEEDLVTTALGDRARGRVGGTKTVVFCRRVSSVQALRERLLQRYLAHIEQRCAVYWNETLDWRRGFAGGVSAAENSAADETESDDDVDGLTEHPSHDDVSPLRAAQARGQWLLKYRNTFRENQRNALVFELNWFKQLCADGGRPLDAAIAAIPGRVWARALAFAQRDPQKRQRLLQFRALVWLCLDRHGETVFALSADAVGKWRAVLRRVLRLSTEQLGQLDPAGDPHADPAPAWRDEDKELLRFDSVWCLCDAHEELRLPGAAKDSSEESLYRRRILATILGQYLRLSDALLDLYAADTGRNRDDEPAHLRALTPETPQRLCLRFVHWLSGNDIDAVRLRRIWRDWCDHLDRILSGQGESDEPQELATRTNFKLLHEPNPVVAISGSAGGHKTAVHQFQTPGMPYVMVGTDTIREGVNLHLFCDRVMHYGVAWTAGDLEQRTGRVDRYFSLIERRLAAPRDDIAPTLDSLFPHLRDTLERYQIERIFERKKDAEAVVDATLDDAALSGHDKDVSIDALRARPEAQAPRSASIEYGTTRHLPK